MALCDPAPKKADDPKRPCWFCADNAIGCHSHFGDYVPVCAEHYRALAEEAQRFAA